jgi:hypothetical protein
MAQRLFRVSDVFAFESGLIVAIPARPVVLHALAPRGAGKPCATNNWVVLVGLAFA